MRATCARGFTLIEVLAASTLLLVGLVTLSAVFLHAAGGNAASRTHTEAASMAQAQLEILRNLSYAELVAGGGLDTLVDDYHDLVDLDGDDRDDYEVTWLIEDDKPRTGCKKVSVRVRSRNSASRLDLKKWPVTFAVYVAEKGT